MFLQKQYKKSFDLNRHYLVTILLMTNFAICCPDWPKKRSKALKSYFLVTTVQKDWATFKTTILYLKKSLYGKNQTKENDISI